MDVSSKPFPSDGSAYSVTVSEAVLGALEGTVTGTVTVC